jgi:hypothetical protein
LEEDIDKLYDTYSHLVDGKLFWVLREKKKKTLDAKKVCGASGKTSCENVFQNVTTTENWRGGGMFD